jgi:hypothetical protein
MATAQLGTLLRHIQKLAALGTIHKWTDRQLLDDFAGRRDETAFSALVSRHGPMVLWVCRRVLNHEQDAEDAFQATFLVLARNTGSIRKRETATVPRVLAHATIRSGLLFAAGETAAGVIPAQVAALAAGVSRAMLISKAKVGVAAILTAALFAAAGMVTHQAPAAVESEATANQKSETPSPRAGIAAKAPETNEAAKDDVIFTGQVVDPDGSAVAGAKLVFLYSSADKVPEKVWATSGKDGRFKLQVAKNLETASWSGSIWDAASVAAAADGFGLGWVRVRPDAPGNLVIHLVKDDVPLKGRILDLQGKPVAGVTVRVDDQLSATGYDGLAGKLESRQIEPKRP